MGEMRSLGLAVAALFALSCTDAGLYSMGGPGTVAGRADMSGTLCMPLAEGNDFPTKIIFAVEGGSTVTANSAFSSAIASALNSIANRFNGASGLGAQFELLGYSAIAQGLLGSFGDATALQSGIIKYGAFSGNGPVSMRAALLLAESLLQGDAETACKGAVGRTRYLVVLVAVSEDTSCANPIFNVGITPACSALTDNTQCSVCELTNVTEQLVAMGQLYGAGQVTVQPIYLRTVQDPITSSQVAAIAQAGGSQAVETDPAGLTNALNGVNYASLQTALVPREFIAFNRQVRALKGQNMVDSDGDGVPDEVEVSLGLDPTNPDTDGDGLMDGVELKMGLDPKTPNILKGCNPFLDSDGDRLNDCEEMVLGTDPCTGDTDGDGLPDLVEVLSGTDPLVPEDLKDSDGDGIPDAQEAVDHTDPLTADLAFRAQYAYGYSLGLASQTTPDGRACYNVAASNVTLMSTLAAKDPNHPNLATKAGVNQIYLYFQVGRPDIAHTQGASELMIQEYTFTPPNARTPSGSVTITPDQFVTGI
jgi:hypothetical protein